jgi:hypothetical protein
VNRIALRSSPIAVLVAACLLSATAGQLSAQQPTKRDSVQPLAPVTVSVTSDPVLDAVGFTMRMEHGQGHYITGEQLAKMSSFRFTDVLRMVPGLTVGINKYGEDVVSSGHSGGSVLSESHGCVQYIVDGLPWDGGSPAITAPIVRGRSSDDPVNQMGVRMAIESAKELSAVLKKSDILGIEIYQGPATPAQYNQGGGNCATVIVWTKENVHSR